MVGRDRGQTLHRYEEDTHSWPGLTAQVNQTQEHHSSVFAPATLQNGPSRRHTTTDCSSDRSSRERSVPHVCLGWEGICDSRIRDQLPCHTANGSMNRRTNRTWIFLGLTCWARCLRRHNVAEETQIASHPTPSIRRDRDADTASRRDFYGPESSPGVRIVVVSSD